MRSIYLLLLLALAWLASCSRESDIKPDGGLKDDRFAVIVSRTRPDSLGLEALLDSVAALDSVIQDDTLGFTINDTAYLIGYKVKKASEVRMFTWKIDSLGSSEGKNGVVYPVVFDKPGIYRTLMLALDKWGGLDSAGERQYLKVVNNPPVLRALKDTVWARHAFPAQVPVHALDSFGMVQRLKVDYDGNGTWDTNLVFTPADTTWLGVPRIEGALDSLDNQRTIILAEDDDAQSARDTVIVHFNRLPVVTLDFPYQNGRVSNKERFAFYYHADDSDNPEDIRYFIQATSGTSDTTKAPILTYKHLITPERTEKSFEVLSAEGKWATDTLGTWFNGFIYWQVLATDGFDTVKSPAQHFFFGSLDQKYSAVKGVARLQGQTKHNGIRVTLEDMQGNRYFASTDTAGAYLFTSVLPGYYNVSALDTASGLGYSSGGIDSIYADLGHDKVVDTLWLRDQTPPAIVLDAVPPDTVKALGTQEVRWFVGDFGSQVAASDIHISLDGVSYDALIKASGRFWTAALPVAYNGIDTVRIWAKDKVGNVSDTLKFDWVVFAKTVALTVNGAASAVVNSDGTLNIVARFANDMPHISAVKWKWTCTQNSTTCKDGYLTVPSRAPRLTEPSREDTLLIGPADMHFVGGQTYTVSLEAEDGTGMPLLASVKFTIRNSDAPTLIFVSPTEDTTVTLGDVVPIAVQGANGTDGTTTGLSYSYVCSGASNTACPAANATSGTVSWSAADSYTVQVTVNDAGTGKSASVTRTVTVLTGAPSVRIRYADSLSLVINQDTTLYALAADVLGGTIAKFEWRCGTLSGIDLNTWTLGSSSYAISAPGAANSNWGCEVRVTDDDGQMDTASIKIPIGSGLPSVSVATKTATVTVKDTLSLKAIASDTLGGFIMQARWSCGAPGSGQPGTVGEYWITPTPGTLSPPKAGKVDTLAVAPDTAAAQWMCIVEVTDNDGNTDRDTSVYQVIADAPRVNAVDQSLTRTIKDKVVLDAYSSDGYGRIVQYAWSCGTAGVAGLGNWVASTVTPRYEHTLPSSADPNYLCVVKVTDDDGQIALDSTHIDVLLDPPSISVNPSTAASAIGLTVPLRATAADGYGSIVKREWSCGAAGVGGVSGWKSVSSFDTSWTMPSSPVNPYYCVARATDDDGNMARDTLLVSISTEVPTLTASPAVQHIYPGDVAEIKVDFGGPWVANSTCSFQCGGAGAPVYQWNMKDSGIVVGGELTGGADTLRCILGGLNGSTWIYDTVTIKKIVNAPIGALSSIDSAFLWSGDLNVPDKNRYYYDALIHGKLSSLGTLGDAGQKQYWWQFSNYTPSLWYQGKSDGTIDTSIYQFNEAFTRLSAPGTVTISLDFRDSTPVAGETDSAYLASFRYRHAAQVVSKQVVFYKAWENQNADSMLVRSASISSIAPRSLYSRHASYTGIVTAYAEGTTGKVVRQNGASKVDMGSFGTDVLGSISLVKDSSNQELWVSYIATDSTLTIKKWNGSSWSAHSVLNRGSLVEAEIVIDPVHHRPVAAVRFNAASGDTYIWLYYYSLKDGWKLMSYPGGYENYPGRAIDLAINSQGTVGVVFLYKWDNKVYFSQFPLLSSGEYDYNLWNSEDNRKVAYDGGDTAMRTLYKSDNEFVLLTPNRNGSGEPIVRLRSSSGTWSTVGGSSFAQRIGTGASIAYVDGYPVVALDDRIWTSSAQVHVWRFDGSKWRMLGENQLPYFNTVFRNARGFYLRGAMPTVMAGPSGSIYLGMHTQETAVSGGTVPGRYNGVMLMKYIGPLD